MCVCVCVCGGGGGYLQNLASKGEGGLIELLRGEKVERRAG